MQSSGRGSLSEEIEHRLQAFDDLDRRQAEAQTELAKALAQLDKAQAQAQAYLSDARAYAAAAKIELDATKIAAIRAAGFAILREVSGRPSSVIISVSMLDAEARSWLSGFTADLPPAPESRQATDEESAQLNQEIERLRAQIDAAKKDKDAAA
jgi:hypothetical protein